MTTDCVLAVDIGNSNVSFGLVRGGRVRARGRIPSATRDPAVIEAALRALWRAEPVLGVALASVAPARTPVWRRVLTRRFGFAPFEISHRVRLGIGLDYPRPETLGADRLVNAAEGAARYGAPLIVADFGTATTFDAICPRRGFVGGVIAPGWPLMLDYLAARAALLPHLSPRRPRRVLGRSTATAMQSGAHYGYCGLTREIVTRLSAELGSAPVRLVLTGGYAPRVVLPDRPEAVHDPDLTLRGLARLYHLNQQNHIS
ncbi:MAG: type III pantothenate kinase [Candidatus Marinimicrobia bacterium]|nr:type III pantothenate kinase [Candidatus Neomarinimicrobiota bacterium]